jgi:hypothetical protein
MAIPWECGDFLIVDSCNFPRFLAASERQSIVSLAFGCSCALGHGRGLASRGLPAAVRLPDGGEFPFTSPGTLRLFNPDQVHSTAADRAVRSPLMIYEPGESLEEPRVVVPSDVFDVP